MIAPAAEDTVATVAINFGNYSRYYDLLYRDKDYAGETAYVESLIRRFNPGARSILELGCGTGVHASMLAANGFRVHGIDSSETMLSRAQSRCDSVLAGQGGAFTVAKGDVRSYRGSENFDGVISLFHVASYQVANADVEAFLRTAACHLAGGGIFIFDFWYGPAVLTERPTVRLKRLEDETIRVWRIAEPTLRPNANLVEVHYSIGISDKTSGAIEVFEELHPMRYFFLPELEHLLVSAGFSSWQAEQWMTGRPPGLDTWGVCVTARK